jgi:Flp pilus assembly protein TadD
MRPAVVGERQAPSGVKDVTMDGRWSLLLTAGFLGGLSGCATSGNRPATGLPIVPATPPAQAQSMQTTQTTASLPLTPHSGKLMPSTHMTMGTLAEQVAEDPNRPAAEREQFRVKARQSYQKAVETDPKFAPGYLALAASYAATNEREQAVAHFTKATQMAPNDAGVWAAQGTYYARVKEWDAAIESLSRAIQLEPGNKEIMKKLGFALARAGRVDEGYAILAKCMSEAEARYNVARMLQHLEQPMACRWYLQMALQADPNYEPAREAMALITGEASSVQPVAYNETPTVQTTPTTQAAPAAPTAPVVQTAGYSEPTAPPAQAAPAASQPIIVVNGNTTAPTTTTTQPLIIVNRQNPPTAPATTAAPTAAAPASSGELPRLPPVILGSRDAPTAPMKAGVEGIDP